MNSKFLLLTILLLGLFLLIFNQSCEDKEKIKYVNDTTVIHDRDTIMIADNDTIFIYHKDTNNLNVNSKDIHIAPNEWVTDTSYNRIFFTRDIPLINQEVINNGAVFVYFKSLSTDEWQILPYTWPGGETIETYWHGLQSLEIERIGGTSIPSMPVDTYIYKIVTVSN